MQGINELTVRPRNLWGNEEGLLFSVASMVWLLKEKTHLDSKPTCTPRQVSQLILTCLARKALAYYFQEAMKACMLSINN